jgi:hypothetical protein
MRRGEIGALLSPAAGNAVPDGCLWAADNSVFGGKYPGDKRYLDWLERLMPYSDRCLFVTAPDVIGSHLRTFARSRDLLRRIREMGFPAAFVAQDGMEWDDSSDLWEWFDVLFIGGTTGWKLGAAAADLVRIARDHGRRVHMGRVSSLKRLRYAQYLGVDTADGTYLTYGPDRLLPNVLDWTNELRSQMSLL